MSKKVLALALVLVMILSFAGCKKDEVVKQDDTATKTEGVQEENLLPEISEFFSTYVNTDARPVAIMVDNDNEDARPQAGLDEAYLVYEMPVEGGSTRFMALFRNAKTEKIGPVRSSRHYFLDFVKENDAIYTHFGWSPKATTDITALKVNNVNGIIASDAGVFWRERKHKNDWHSAYTNIEKIEKLAADKKYNTKTETANGIKYSKEYINLPAENVAKEIVLPYAGFYKTGYKYNEEKGVYEKQINNAPHKMQNGNVVEFKNVIVELIADTSLGDGSARREIITTGTGKGYYFTNGAYEEITWSKASRTAPTVYKKANGEELLVNPGHTMVNIISPAIGVNIK